jgi:uncharacterized YigZ family protein
MTKMQRTSIKVLSQYSESKMKEKGSTFIGQAFFIANEEEATAKLNEIRKKYYDATHNCYAYRIYNDKFKYSDDGEPNGTAGIRIFGAIEHFDLQNILVVVTRYYGGVKLGVGPLGKAYYQSAFDSLQTAKVEERTKYQKIKISYEYSFVKTLHKTVADFEGSIIQNSYDTTPFSECFVYPECIDEITKVITNLSSGKAKVEKIDQILFK